MCFRVLADVLRFDDKDSLLINHIMNNTPEDSVVFLTGVGKSYPILRSHKILNNLHPGDGSLSSDFILPWKIQRRLSQYFWRGSK